MCWAIYSGHETRVFPTGRSIFQVKSAWGRVGRRLRGAHCGRVSPLISSVIRVMRREIEAQLIVSMLVLDTAADAIVRRAVNHHQHDEERT
jgi:hypothetical protein